MPNTTLLKQRMKAMHITQAQIAREICVGTSDACRKINNIRTMSLDEAEKIAQTLQIRDEEFSDYFFAPSFA